MRHQSSLLLLVALLLATPALAHTGGAIAGGFTSGFEHPVKGLDHLLAMLAVGLWGAQIGGRSIWTLPVAFPLVMAVGGLIGVARIEVPQVELMIALSVLGLGAAIALALKPVEWLAILAIGIFALFHGYAHGAELPTAADPAAYGVGFVVATGLIHLAGIGIGLLVGQLAQGRVTRGLGALIAAAGLWFIVA